MNAPAADTSAADQEVLQWYTRARRIPTLIGRLPKGGRLWGGPYTITQVVGMVLVFLGGQKTMGLWGRFSWIGNWVALLAVSAATGFALRLVKTGGRDPLTALLSLLGLGTGASTGTYEGRPIRLPRSHPVTHRINALPGPLTSPPPAPTSPTSDQAPTSPAKPRPQTAVQQLLRAAATRLEEER